MLDISVDRLRVARAMASIERMTKEENPASIAEADRAGIAAFLERLWSEDGLGAQLAQHYPDLHPGGEGKA